MTLDRSPLFGFPIVNPGDRFTDDDGAFGRLGAIIEPYLAGMLNHTHDGIANELSAPSDAPTAELSPTGGSITAGGRRWYVYTLVDAHGRESIASDPVEVTIPEPVGTPDAPSVAYSPVGGTMLSGTYAYALAAYTEADNHLETLSSPAAALTVPVGSTTNTVTITFPTLPAGASGWNIYRMRPGTNGAYVYLDSVDMTVDPPATYTDDGTVTEDAQRLSANEDNTSSSNSIEVVLPGATPSVPAGYTWRVYRTDVDGVWSNSFIHHVVEETAENSGVITPTFTDIGYAALPGEPPATTSGIPNPGKIDMATHTIGALPYIRVAGDVAAPIISQSGAAAFDLRSIDAASMYILVMSTGGAALDGDDYITIKLPSTHTPARTRIVLVRQDPDDPWPKNILWGVGTATPVLVDGTGAVRFEHPSYYTAVLAAANANPTIIYPEYSMAFDMVATTANFGGGAETFWAGDIVALPVMATNMGNVPIWKRDDTNSFDYYIAHGRLWFGPALVLADAGASVALGTLVEADRPSADASLSARAANDYDGTPVGIDVRIDIDHTTGDLTLAAPLDTLTGHVIVPTIHLSIPLAGP